MTTPDSQAGRTDLSTYVRAVLRHKLMIVSMVFVASVIAIIAALVMTPVYRSQVLVVAVSEEGSQIDLMSMAGGLGALAGFAGLNANGGGAQEEALATLASRIFTTRFVEQHSLLSKLFYENWDEEAGEWDVEDPDSAPDLADGFERFHEIRTISVDKRTGLITIGIEWDDRFAAAEWANALVSDVNRGLRERAILEANTSIKYLEEELAKTSVMELKQAIYRLVESQIQMRMLANVRQEFAFKVIDPAVPAAADKQIAPKRKLMVLSAFAVSLFFAIGLALVLEGMRVSPH